MISRLDMDGKRISEREDMSTEISQTENTINTKVKVKVSVARSCPTQISKYQRTHTKPYHHIKKKKQGKNHEETRNEKDLLMANKHMKEVQ